MMSCVWFNFFWRGGGGGDSSLILKIFFKTVRSVHVIWKFKKDCNSCIKYTLLHRKYADNLHAASPDCIPYFVHKQMHFSFSCFSSTTTCPPPLLHPLENTASL